MSLKHNQRLHGDRFSITARLQLVREPGVRCRPGSSEIETRLTPGHGYSTQGPLPYPRNGLFGEYTLRRTESEVYTAALDD